MNTRAGITVEQTKACRIVLIELAELLAPWWNDIVVVGGMAVQLSIKEPIEGMLQTMDVDLALDVRTIRRPEVPEDIHSTLLAAKYDESGPGGKAFRYFRTVAVAGQAIRVPVDFLTGQKFGTDPARSYEQVEGIHVSKLSGCELAFQQPVSVELVELRSDGSTSTESVQIPSEPYLLAMKGFALHDRRPKDAYDIYIMISSCSGGIEGLVNRLIPLADDSDVRHGLVQIRRAFRTIDAWGPEAVVGESQLTGEAAADIERAAFESVAALLDALGIP